MKTFDFTNAITPAPKGAANQICFYDDIDDLPMFRLNQFQIHLAQESGIGSTLNDFDKRLQGVYDAIGADDKEGAIRELQNAKIGWSVMLAGVSISCRALADLVYSIDEKPVTDFSNTWLTSVVAKKISERFTRRETSELLEILKKKLTGI